MEIEPLVTVNNSLTILIAPPAWGKTSLLLKLPKPWIFIAPLRALAEEFAKRLKDEGHKVKLIRRRNQDEWKLFAKNPSGVLVATPETLPSFLPELVVKKCVLVLDEFHLFQKWGDGFRPFLREQLYAWANSEARMLGLSATIDEEQLQEVKAWSSHSFSLVNIIDVGNMRFHHAPSKIINYGNSKNAIQRKIVYCANNKKNKGIIFCHSRSQVKVWQDWFLRRGINCLSCIGGEVAHFRKQLEQNEDVSWIVATSVLSHGVNLPSFNHVFIAYKPESHSMWLQMAARGGRRGERFIVHSMGKINLIDRIKLWGFDVWVRLQLYWIL